MADPLATFPDTPLGLRAELQLNGTWTDITSYLHTGQVTLGRGHPDESTSVSPSTLGMALTNGDGRFTSTNPLSPYWPYLVRNTPCRISVPAAAPYLRLEAPGGYASCPPTAGLSITGDLDIQLQLRLSDWQPALLASKWNSGSSYRSWVLVLNADGTVGLVWSPDGTTEYSGTSTAPVPYGTTALRVTLATATSTTTFYTASTVAGPWTQLGSTMTRSAATSVFGGGTSSAPVVIGYNAAFTETWFAGGAVPSGLLGAVTEFRLLSGIGGTAVADANFAAQSAGTTSFSDGHGNTWGVTSPAEISARSYRGHFEVPEWPVTQDETGTTVTVDAAGGGLLRRLGQRQNPVDSALKRSYLRLTPSDMLVAYWPGEDGAASSRISSALGGPAMAITGTPGLASSSVFAASAPLPLMENASFTGAVPAYSGGTACVFRFLLSASTGVIANNGVIASMLTTGTVTQAVLTYGTGGGLQLAGYNPAGTQLFSSGMVTFGVDGQPMLVQISIAQAGTSVTWHIDTMRPGAPAQTGFSGTLASASAGQVRRVSVNPGGAMVAAATGHYAVQAVYDSNQLGNSGAPLNAWYGETAAARFSRLCGEEGIACRILGQAPGTAVMGYQQQQTLTQLLQEVADTDRGVWLELRQQLGWGYRTRASLYAQSPGVQLDYAADQVDLWPSPPVEDDQTISNDVTVTQASGGATARQFAAPGQPVTGGRLSTQAPPSGVGVYDGGSLTVSLADDSQLDYVASWEVWRGTVDQPRFPGIGVSLDNRDAAAIRRQVLDLDLGDRLDILHPPDWLPPQVTQMAQQVTETLSAYSYPVVITGVPYTPYDVAVAGTAHADTDGSALASSATSTATTLSVATTGASGLLWTTVAGNFPFDVMVSGERMTVTAISGASSPQSFTVTRSVNGVVKSHAAAEAVSVYPSPVAAL